MVRIFLQKIPRVTLFLNPSYQQLNTLGFCVLSKNQPTICSAFIFLRRFKLAHIHIQVIGCTLHDGCKQGIDRQMFNRKSISGKITHPQSLFKSI